MNHDIVDSIRYATTIKGTWLGYGGGWPSGTPCKRCQKVMVAWGVRFCEECKKFVTSCPATHAKDSESCNLCRTTPGYVEVIQ